MSPEARQSVLDNAVGVKIGHFRHLKGGDDWLSGWRWRLDKLGPSLDPRGGMCMVLIEMPDDPVPYSGIGYCSMEDNYCKATGREIALGRAIKAVLNG